MKYLILIALLFIGCVEQDKPDLGLNDMKRPIIVVAKTNYNKGTGWSDISAVTLRDSENKVIVFYGSSAVQFIDSYKVGDTLK